MLARGLALLMWMTLSGCGRQTADTASSSPAPGIMSALVGSAHETGVSLGAFAVRDTFDSADSVMLGYVMRNHGSATQMRLDPRFFEVHVYDDTGKPVPVQSAEWHGSTGASSDILLPAGGFVGQVFSLQCGNLGAEPLQNCDRRVTVSRAGSYRALIAYSPPPRPDGNGVQYPTLNSDTVRFVIARNK
jgi:hypothetical protein